MNPKIKSFAILGCCLFIVLVLVVPKAINVGVKKNFSSNNLDINWEKPQTVSDNPVGVKNTLAGNDSVQENTNKLSDLAKSAVLTPTYPLKVSDNGRYLADQNDQPVFLSGDAAWSLIVQLTDEDAAIYLTSRQSYGFNAVITELIEHKFSTYAPKNIYQVAPFTGKIFTTPNPNYFTHVDYVINTAKDKGITVFLSPLYLGYECNDDGWCADVKAASISDMQSWGNYIGNRYKNYTNIVWVVGGDCDPVVQGVSDKLIAFAKALKAADPNHLITAHPFRHQLATTPAWSDKSWITLRSAFPEYLDTSTMIGLGYANSPIMPVFNIEGWYENEHSMTTQKLRAQAYWTVLAGGLGGYLFGNCPMWSFGFALGYCSGGFDPNWKANLNSPGTIGMSYAASLFRLKEWYALIPDAAHVVAIAGYGVIDTDNYITTARVNDGSLVMAYFPSNMTLTIDMTKLNGPVSASWYDPTNGVNTVINGSPFPNTGIHKFTPTGNNKDGDGDWILVLETKRIPNPTPTPKITPIYIPIIKNSGR